MATERRRRRHWTEKEKREHVARFAESGETIARYCSESKVPMSTFMLWRREWRRGEAEASVPPCAAGFAQVLVKEFPASYATVVHLPDGIKLEVALGADPRWVGQLIKTLRTSG